MEIAEFKNVEVSYYSTLMTSTGRTISLAEFLAKDFSREVLAMRFAPTEGKRKRAKRSLPAVTVSGVFEPARRTECLVGHSGLICVDIDAKDNPSRNFVGPFPNELTEWDIISYLSRSASGKGLFAIVKLKWPLRHKDHFRSLEKEFARRGFVIDKACSDITRLRCATYDPWPYYNPSATVFDGLESVDEPDKTRLYRPKRVYSETEDTGVVARLVSLAVAERRIVLDDYGQWIRAGYALAALGEDGRSLFHQLSATSAKYSRWECDRKFSDILRTSRGEISLGTLFRMLGG